jgi:hypothetical protein
MQHNETKTNTEPNNTKGNPNTKTAHEWVDWVVPTGVDDAHWAELTPKQKAVIAHRLICISEYRKEMK